MSVTEEQVEFFNNILECSTWEPGEFQKAIDIAGEIIKESQDKIDRLTNKLASKDSNNTEEANLRVKELEGKLAKAIETAKFYQDAAGDKQTLKFGYARVIQELK
jgi:hypothetical protein